MRKCSKYGQRYWCIKVPKSISKDGEIYVYADHMEVTASGALVAHGGYRDHDANPNVDPKVLEIPEFPVIVLALALGHWNAFYAACLIDGAAVAVEHWEGEVISKSDSE